MKCAFCNEEATVHLTQIVGEKMQKIDLCEKCAKEKGISDSMAFSLTDMLLGEDTSKHVAHEGELSCPQCGFTQTDFKKTGRLGCPACYQTFAEIVETILKDMHKGVVHRGKTPKKFAKVQFYQSKIKRLQEDLKKAVAQEKYEEAATIRDEIAQLENLIKS
ncbi:UvrB/UvrC motif-containing protein [Candidatus Methylacidiphilum infernorum]|uniref:UvrB/UvrC motif-containing protein n=1 Tax=Candidatus Methylacidiphilum infernorum TaxID=511746 RepID=A0ABX7PU05_9BACT|nr:UvrB/UvrC motif-containing protein [Candidatus Methylacidiphilum infernorum]QSR86148.1 UvrB/UvrC motif-containing protein [Candidatus Methylacidiphilum infernorum]